jgi:hypothetical protein
VAQGQPVAKRSRALSDCGKWGGLNDGPGAAVEGAGVEINARYERSGLARSAGDTSGCKFRDTGE